MGYKVINSSSRSYVIPAIYGGGTLAPGGSVTILDNRHTINDAFGNTNPGLSTDPLEFYFSRGDVASLVPGAVASKPAVDARISGSATVVANPGSAALIQFAQVDRDTESGMSADKKTYTVAKAGEYLVLVTIGWLETFTPSASLSVFVNALSKMIRAHGPVTAGDAVQVTALLTCAVGDKIDARAYHQDAGITHNVWTQNGNQPNLQIRQL